MSKMWGPYYNHPLMKILRFFTDIVILNLIFIACCLPIVTIGASATGMYHVTMRMVRKEYPDIVKDFFRSFRQNFFQATVLWGVIVLFGILMGADLYLIYFRIHGTTIKIVLSVLLGILGITILVGLEYLFAYVARFKNSTMNCIKNTFILGILNLQYTIILLFFDFLVIFIFMKQTAIMMYLSFFIFAFIAYVKSNFIVKVFRKYE